MGRCGPQLPRLQATIEERSLMLYNKSAVLSVGTNPTVGFSYIGVTYNPIGIEDVTSNTVLIPFKLSLTESAKLGWFKSIILWFKRLFKL